MVRGQHTERALQNRRQKDHGYEGAEQFGWELPDVILYPCGGGVGLIGMWKAFDE